MNEYEITYLIDSELEENQRNELDSKIDGKIVDMSGIVERTEPTLRRKLAYPINKKYSAFYRTLHIKLNQEDVQKFDIFLKKEKSVMRHVLLNTPKRERIKQDIIEKHTKQKQEKKTSYTRKNDKRKPEKKVTMKSVEKGIEQALQEEVK